MIVVAHVLPDLAVGGGQRLLAWIAATDPHVRHTVFALGSGPMEAEFVALGSPPTVVGDAAPRARRERLEAMIIEVGAQVVHVHTPEQRSLAVGAGEATGTPVVMTFHGLTTPTTPLGTGRNRLGRRGATVLRRRVRRQRTVQGVAALTAVSAAARDLNAARIGIDPDTITLVRPGLPAAAFAAPTRQRTTIRRDLGIGPDVPVLITVGSMTESKGSLLIPAFVDRVVARIPEAVLLVVGDGPARTEVGEVCDAVGLTGHVRFCGPRSAAEVLELVDGSDLYVSTSLSESFGLAVLEAMARGRPVVGFHTGGFDEFFESGTHGELVEHPDPFELASLAVRWLEAPGRRASAGAAAARRASAFPVEQTAAGFEAVYRQVAG